jgi:ribonuclease PH
MELDYEMWSFTHGMVSSAAGSGYIESPTHKVLCVVSSPSEFTDLTQSEESQRHAQAQLSISSPFSAQVRSALSSLILLDKYPKALIEVKVQVLEGDESSALVHILNAASIAVLDSGIEAKDTMIAANAGIEEGKIVLGKNEVVAGVLVNLDQLALVTFTGVHTENEVILMVQASIDAAKHMFAIVKNNF